MNNNFNKTTLLAIVLVSGLMALSSCYKKYNPVKLLKPNPGKVYMPQALSNPIHVKLTGALKIDTLEYSANIGGVGAANNDLHVSFMVNSSLVNEYNSAHSTSLTLLPQDNYTLIKKEAVIPAGTKHGPLLKLVIKDKPVLVKDKKYMLPIILKIDSGGLPVIKDLQTVYFLVVSDVIPPPTGQGTTADPYKITSLLDLQWMRRHASAWDATYIQTKDIDLSSTQQLNDGKGFIPIGNGTTKFNGTYDGQGHTIKGLYINRPDEYYVGFFGSADDKAVIKNITFTQVDITGKDDAAALVGINYGLISGVDVASGKITGGAKDNIASLVGSNHGNIENSSAEVPVTAQGSHIGGLVGYSAPEGTVKNSYATGDVTSADHEVGGLIGDNHGTIINCYATGDVHSEDVYAGGLVGINYGTIKNSHATGEVSGSGDNGGLVGDHSNGDSKAVALISHCYSTGGVIGTGSHSNGGFVGYSTAPIEYSYSTGDVQTVGSGSTGGLLGYGKTDATVTYCFATGDVSTGGSYAGGLVGDTHKAISNSYATGDVIGVDYSGGLVGQLWDEKVTNCYSTGKVTSSTGVGGLVGSSGSGGGVTKSYWDTQTSGLSNSDGGTGLTSSQMQGSVAQSNMPGLDFTNVWQTNAGGYPTLRNNHQ